MEENVDSIKESIRREDDSSKKDIIDIDSPKETSTLINTNSQDSNKQKVGGENSIPLKIKPKKELPIEKKPFNEFINDYSEKREDNDDLFDVAPERDLREPQPTISVNYRVIKNNGENELKDSNQTNNNSKYDDDWNNNGSEW